MRRGKFSVRDETDQAVLGDFYQISRGVARLDFQRGELKARVVCSGARTLSGIRHLAGRNKC